MRDILFSQPATDDFRKLPPDARHSVIDLMQEFQLRGSGLKPRRMYSVLLGTTLYLVRKAGLRLLFEINDGRAVILAVTWRA